MLPATSFAADKQTGVYVAPKFVYGLTQMNSPKASVGVEGLGQSSMGVGSKTDSTFGGSIAIGYDFSKQQGIPLRAELEYAIFSNAKVQKSFAGTNGDGGIGTPGTWEYNEKYKQTYGIQTLFLNAYYDFKTDTIATPYIGAGLGMGFIKTKGEFNGTWEFDDFLGISALDGEWDVSLNAGSKTVTNFAWNIGAGVGFDLAENWTLDAGYRFVSLGSVKTKTGTFEFNGVPIDEISGHGKTKNLYQHQFALGLRYTF